MANEGSTVWTRAYQGTVRSCRLLMRMQGGSFSASAISNEGRASALSELNPLTLLWPPAVASNVTVRTCSVQAFLLLKADSSI